MRIYNYDANGYYTGSNYEFQGKILPKFTTKVVPPKATSGTRAKFDTTTETWKLEFIKDYNKDTTNIKENKLSIKNPKSTLPIETNHKQVEITNDNNVNSDSDEVIKLKKEITSLKEELDKTKAELKLAKTQIKNFTKKLSFKF